MRLSAKVGPLLKQGLEEELEKLSFDEQRVAIGIFLKEDRGQKLWDLLTGLRGPDEPSERSDQDSTVNAANYAGRRKRKYNSTEVIREAAFFGVVGGSARYHQANEIILPPGNEWDHFDKHMARSAHAVGLKIMDKRLKEVDE